MRQSTTTTTYILRSCKGAREYTGTLAEACHAAREWQAEIQAAWGVTVERADGDGATLYTAE